MLSSLILESVLSLFLASFTGNVVIFDYSIALPSETHSTQGRVAFSDTAFRIQDERQEIWCNGTERWIIDRTAEEVYVEPVDGLDASSIMKMFTPVSEGPDGKVVLKPSDQALSYMKGLVLYFDGAALKRAEITLEEGSAPLKVFINSQKIKDPESESFTFDTGSLPESYVITDLR